MDVYGPWYYVAITFVVFFAIAFPNKHLWRTNPADVEWETPKFKTNVDKLRRAATYGNVQTVKRVIKDTCEHSSKISEVLACKRNLVKSQRGSTCILDVVIEQQFSVISQGLQQLSVRSQRKRQEIEKRLVENFDKIFDIIMPYSELQSCSIILAIHYRLFRFVDKIAYTMEPSDLQKCFEEIDIYGEHVLHIVSKSKASGFARYFIRQTLGSRKCEREGYACNDTFNDRLLLQSSDSLFSDNQLQNPDFFTYAQLGQATGVMDLEKLLAYGLKIPTLNLRNWLNRRNENGETPMMLACRYGRPDAVRVFLSLREQIGVSAKVRLDPTEAVVDLEVHENIWKGTCMHWIASRAHVDVLAIFEKYVDPQILNLLITGSKDAFGRTPFDLGCTKDNPIIIKKFINIIRAARPLDGASMKKSSSRLQTLERSCYAEASRRKNSLLSHFLANTINDSVNLTKLKVHHSTLDSLQNKSASEVLGRSRQAHWGKWKRYSLDPDYDVIDRGGNQKCKYNVAVEINLPETKFLEEYYSRYEPVVVKIRGHRNASKMWFENKAWSRDEFLGRYGALKTTVSKVPYGDVYGERSIRMSLQDFVRHHMGKDFISASGQQKNASIPSYVFDGGYLWHSQFEPLIRQPSFLAGIIKRPELKQFALGARGSGAQPHFHQQTWNTLIYGRKRWYFEPPPNGPFYFKPSLSFFRETILSKKVGKTTGCYEHIQHSGETIYVPEMYSHATLNLDDSLGVAMAFA